MLLLGLLWIGLFSAATLGSGYAVLWLTLLLGINFMVLQLYLLAVLLRVNLLCLAALVPVSNVILMLITSWVLLLCLGASCCLNR